LDTSTTLMNYSPSSHDEGERVKLQCIAVEIVDDLVAEDKESFTLSLTNNDNILTLYSSSTVVISDDDAGTCIQCTLS